MISAVSSTSNTKDATAPAPSANKQDALANKEVFLQLLVAQLKNQDPSKPQDGVQFITQLAQFSGLEQSLTTNKELAAIREILATPAATPTK